MPNEPFKKQPPSVRKFALLVIALGITALFIALITGDLGKDSIATFVIVFLVALVIELVPLEEVAPIVLGEMTLTEAVHLASIALFGYGLAVPVGVASCAIAEIARRRDWYKALFNTAAYSITLAASGIAYMVVDRAWSIKPLSLLVPFAASALTYRVVSIALTSTIESLGIDRRIASHYIVSFKRDGILFIAATLLGLSGVYLYRLSPLYSTISIVPVVALAIGYGKSRRFIGELVKASEVQRSLFPSDLLDHPSIQIAFRCDPFRDNHLSGDFFDVFDEDDSTYFAIGDAMGKGIHAALVATSQQYLLRAISSTHDTAEVLGCINRLACERSEPESFLTMFCARYDTTKRRLRWSNAGHPPPIYCEGETGECRLLTNGGVALGAYEQAVYDEEILYLNDDDVVVLYTDGAIEYSLNARRIGTAKLTTIVRENRDKSAEEIVEIILNRLDEASGGKRKDDLIVAVLKLKPVLSLARV